MTDRQPSASASARLHNLLNAYRPTVREEAVEAHRREVLAQAADVLEQANPDRDADFSAGVDWAIDMLRSAAAPSA